MKTKKTLQTLIWLLLAAALAAFAFANRHTIGMPRRYPLETTAFVRYGAGKHLLLADQGKASLERLDGMDTLLERRQGETLGGFYYAEQAAEGPDGTLYIADRAYRETADGGTEMLERVLEFQGRKRRVVWEEVPEAGESFVAQTTSFYEMQYAEGKVWFLRREGNSLALYAFAPGQTAQLVLRVYIGDTLTDASYDLSAQTLVVTTRRGYVRVRQKGGQDWVTVPKPDSMEHLMPSSVSARGGRAYLSDVFSNSVFRFPTGEPEAGLSLFCEDGNQYIDLEASADGRELLGSDGAGFCRIGQDSSVYADTVTYARYPLTLLARLSALAAVLMILWSLRGLLPFLGNLFRSEAALRVVIVIAAAVAVSVFVAYSLMTELFAQEDDTLLDNMKLFAEIARGGIDKEALRELQWETDYGGSAYNRVRKPMDDLIRLSYAENTYYYYVLYRLDGDVLRMTMNADDYAICGEPYAMGDQDYSAEVQRTGKSYALRTRDADGDWINVLIPVADREGRRFAVLEVGLDMGLRLSQRRATAVEMVLSVACSTAVVMMLILEGLFLLTFMERRRSQAGKTAPGPAAVPVRTLMVVSYVADSMQEPFIAALCASLYRGGLPLPDGAAAALPMSGELLAMAIASALAGPLSEKLGSRKLLGAGMAAQLAGSICCFTWGSYTGLLAGKLFIGAGMGLIYVCCNTVASAAETEDETAAAFAGISAGTLSGMSIGAGLASLFLSIGGWRMTYMVGAILLVGGLALALASGDIRPGGQDRRELDEYQISFSRFFLNRKVLGYFVLILVPFMMSLSYREYFFPIYALDRGMSETRIGQIYLLCGMLVLYFGPGLTAWMLRTFGALWSVIIASALMGANMLLFVVHPSLGSVLAGVAIVYAVFSFASGCQYTYFQELPEALGFGEGKAMGIYSVFESLGQTLGPVTYGLLLSFGQRGGIGVFSAVMLALVFLFTALLWKLRRVFH